MQKPYANSILITLIPAATALRWRTFVRFEPLQHSGEGTLSDFQPHNSESDRFSWIHVDDLVNLLYEALLNPSYKDLNINPPSLPVGLHISPSPLENLSPLSPSPPSYFPATLHHSSIIIFGEMNINPPTTLHHLRRNSSPPPLIDLALTSEIQLATTTAYSPATHLQKIPQPPNRSWKTNIPRITIIEAEVAEFGFESVRIGGELADVEIGEDDEEETLPPLEIVARGSPKLPHMTFSVLEGARRTLKGMELDEEHTHVPDDPFLRFVDYAISILSPKEDEDVVDEESNCPAWSWVTGRIIKTCRAYSSGVTPAILLSELSQAWTENQRGGYSKKKRPECVDQFQKKQKRGKLPNTITIDSIYEKNFLSLTSVLEVFIVDAFLLPGTNFYMLTLGDFWSSNTVDLYLHRRFYDLADLKNGILRKGRELLLTGCYLRTTTRGSGHLRLLPTEYLLIILDEDEDDDAMLLGAQFCSDSLSSISVDDANRGVSYSLYARIESIGSLEIQGKFGSLQRKQITLVDNDNFRVKFLLWGDQVVLANCFSVGSWLAIDQPFVSSCIESTIDSAEEICLEYGSVTQLYIVPFILHKEQVSVASTQNHYQGSKLLVTAGQSQGSKVSQVTLPCDSRGAIDFSNYPFRLFVADLREKMCNISIYGVITDMNRTNNQESTFSLRIEDPTGGIWAKLHFVKSWSLGKLSIGHTVYIAGLTCSMTKSKSIEVSWDEKEGGCLFVNLSCLPALLNSSCLHKSSTLSDLSANNISTHVCQIWLDQIEHCDVNVRYFHISCGHIATQKSGFKCNFCRCHCDDDIGLSFHLKVTIADDTRKVLAWCTGHTAIELLQISPDEFSNLPEEEQIMYPSSLEHERFTVALVNSKGEGFGRLKFEDDLSICEWEITQALKTL
ncbi:hypothetical protein SSX86_016985 [Deinandra increscens subsp. villosa]|uniref:Uncharacterized protein n=1 Tax=Deinandra increscens subsp. villosa TaxID=3103831 RepID=A0AAP0CU88_9ASTR